MASCEQKHFLPLLLPISSEIQENAVRSSVTLRLERCWLWVTWNKWKTNRKITWGITLSKNHWTQGELAYQIQNSFLLSCWMKEGNSIYDSLIQLRCMSSPLFCPWSSAVPEWPQTHHKQHPREVSGSFCWQTQACLTEGISGVACQALVPFSPSMNPMVCQGCEYFRKRVLS